ncbi:MAG: choice-of-anchor J domain-containing protein [Bacteroidales bacterium]|nr:choice-of-anchor J domain-containing protein [Bacteroidales bacterium]
MKKSIWTVLLSALVALLAVGCAKEADLSDLKNKVSDLDKRVTALEDAIDEINKETIPGLKNLVDAVNNKITIQSVVEGDGEYTINFTDGTSAVIKNGEDGDDAEAPVISITLGEDGIYYWTVNGQLMKDEAGNPLPVTAKGDKGDKGETGDKGEDGDKGDKGEDGITPLFGTSSEGKVIVSYDNGETWKPLGFSVIDGSAFTSAYIDENKSTEDYIVLVVGETEVQIPKEKTFSLKITYDGKLNSVGINAGETIALEYAVQGVSSTDEVTVDILSATAGITAKIAAVDAVSGYIMISVPAADPEATEPAKIEGKIFVFADNNKGKSNIKVISLEKGEIAAVADVSAQAPAAGGEFELTVTTNKEYNVNVNDEAASWLSVVETKATHTDKLKIVAAKNETGAYRVGTVTINDRNTADKIEEFTVVQQPSAEVATDIASVRELEDGAPVFVKDAIVLAATKSGVLVGDANGGYVYVPLKDNLAVVRGDVVSFSGVKKTAEAPAITYVEVESIEDDDYEGEIPDLALTHYSIAAQEGGSTTIHTTFVANLEKDAESGVYVAVPFYGDQFVIDTPLNAIDFSAFENKTVVVEGYTNGGIPATDTAAGVYEFMINSIKELTYSVTPDWTLSFKKGVLTNTTVGEGASEWYSFIVVKADAVGGESSPFATVEELIADYFPYKQDDYQLAMLYEYADLIDYYGPEMIIGYFLDDAIKKGTGSISGIPYGDYIGLAFGMEDGTFNLTGHYAVLPFTYEDPHVAADYKDFIGEWVFGSDRITISEKVNGESYNVTGLPDQDENWNVVAKYENGSLALYEQDVYTAPDGSIEILSGVIQQKYVSYPFNSVDANTPDMLFKVSKTVDNEFDVMVGSNTKHDIVFDGAAFLNAKADKSDMNSVDSGLITFPASIIPYVYVPYNPELPFAEGFENGFIYEDLWTMIDADGDGYGWYQLSSESAGHASEGHLTSASYGSGKALTPDNWAFTPQINLKSGNYLSFWVTGQDPSWNQEHYAVYITDQEPSAATLNSCTLLLEQTFPGGEPAEVYNFVNGNGKNNYYQRFVVAIPAAYENKTCYIGFRHYDCTDMFRLNIDDVEVTEGAPAVSSVPSSVASSVKPQVVGSSKVVSDSVPSVKSARVISAPKGMNAISEQHSLKGKITKRSNNTSSKIKK